MKKVSSLFVLIGFSCITFAQTVTIGAQVWMSKNLDVSTFRNGDPITQAKTVEEWKNATDNQQPAWCYFDNDATKGKKYGKLYNWYAVSDPRGLAPAGYHVPTDAEWTTLIDYLGGESEAGKKMKSAGGWKDKGNGTNESGFSGLPGGNRGLLGYFHSFGSYGGWWSATERSKFRAWSRALSYSLGTAYREDEEKDKGLSVRCIRD